MEFTTFVRKPFEVEAVEITTENIEDLAELVGTLKHKENGTPYIQVDKRLVPNIYRVYPGFWLTRMGDNVRCYSRRIFHDQFVEKTSNIDFYGFLHEAAKKSGVTVTEEVPANAGS